MAHPFRMVQVDRWTEVYVSKQPALVHRPEVVVLEVDGADVRTCAECSPEQAEEIAEALLLAARSARDHSAPK